VGLGAIFVYVLYVYNDFMTWYDSSDWLIDPLLTLLSLVVTRNGRNLFQPNADNRLNSPDHSIKAGNKVNTNRNYHPPTHMA